MSSDFHAELIDEWSRPPRFEKLQLKLRTVGIWVMSFGGMVISGAFVLFGCLAATAMLSIPAFFAVPILIIAILISGWHVMATIVALLRPQLPAPMQVALMQPSWPGGLKWFVAGWWLLHLSMGAMLAISTIVDHPKESWGVVLLITGLSAVFTYAAHGFLMLVVTCFTKRSDWVTRAWGWRRISTVGHALAVLVAALAR